MNLAPAHSLRALHTRDLLPDPTGWPDLTLVAAQASIDPRDDPHTLALAAPHEEGQRSLTWLSKTRRQHWLAGRVAALQVGRRLGLPMDAAQVDSDQMGAPLLRWPGGSLPVSITHSGDWAMAAAAPGWRLGIDYEVGIVDQFHLCRRICAPGEAQRHGVLDPEAPHERRRRALEEIWTLKEALLKAFGVGLIAELRSFHVLERGPCARLEALEPLHPAIAHPLPQGLKAAVCDFEGHALALVASPV